jgi:hypothetical protein
MNNRASPYWADPVAVTGQIRSTTAAARVLQTVDPVRGPILTGATGLPITATQINPGFAVPGVIPITRRGDATVGYPEFSVTLTGVYTIAEGLLKGVQLGGTASGSWNRRAYYFYRNGVTADGSGRELLRYPNDGRLDLIVGYERKFGRTVWTSRLNVSNLLNHYDVIILPNQNTGYSPTTANAGFVGQPRAYVWTNSFRF